MVRKGFTLIELLVVIAIIAILAAILFPVFAQAREKARAITCVSNEKQICLSLNMYAQDYDETFPMAQSYGTYNTSLPIELAPYVQKVSMGQASTAGVWHCPDDSAAPTSDGSMTPPAGTLTQTYAPVWGGGNDLSTWGVFDSVAPYSTGYIPGRPMSEFQDPSGTFAIVETADPANFLGNNFPGVQCPYTFGGNGGCQNCTDALDWYQACGTNHIVVPGKPDGWHSGGWNYGYVDGHVHWLRPEQTVGKGVNGTMLHDDGTTYCSYNWQPCGPWTISADD